MSVDKTWDEMTAEEIRADYYRMRALMPGETVSCGPRVVDLLRSAGFTLTHLGDGYWRVSE